MEAGKHGYDGKCAPSADVTCFWARETFSLGVFEWVPRACGKGLKRGRVKVRVSGPFDQPERVHAKAASIVAELDAGTYTGPKSIRV
jgi:hypothetical protein